MLIDFRERGNGGERERVASDWESNLQCFGVRVKLQEPRNPARATSVYF